MDISTVVIIGLAIVAIVVFFAIKNRKTADTILQESTNVVPLMLQKSTQTKVSRLQQATEHDIDARQDLQNLVTAYKTNIITIQQYNQKLDAMLTAMRVEL